MSMTQIKRIHFRNYRRLATLTQDWIFQVGECADDLQAVPLS